MNKKFLLFLLFCVVCTVQCFAQKIDVPYQFGFESGKGDWTLNVGKRGLYCEDRWFVNKLEKSEGEKGLYISCDRGKTSNYGMKPNVVVAKRVIELETGNYDISFDWKVWGEAGVSELYVCALPEGYMIGDQPLESNDTIGFLPKAYSRFVQPLMTNEGERLALSGATAWSNASFALSTIAGRKIELMFVWCNANRDTLSSPLGAAIDNIQINSANCPKPENLRTETDCGVMKLMWDGYAVEYECGYKRIGSKFWNNEYGIDGDVDEPSCTWENMEEGAYDVRVRGIKDNDTSAYVYLNTVVVWCPDNHCFDFVSLDNKEVVTCEHGKAIKDPLDPASEYSMAVCPPIDFGGTSIYSRHTTNWDVNETDPRTGNKLTLIPKDGLASVRLGNWDSGAEAERITYEFEVVGDLVLLMKYAVVLEKPGHGLSLDPYFGLEILEEDGTPISKNATCGEAYFSPDKDPDMWEPSGAYVWKDWTTIGVDLRECKGQKIKIQLTTQDCVNGAHGGYAYFTLDCVDATIKSDGCDVVTLEAPAGFKYRWYNDVNEDFTSGEQKISIPVGDNSEYFCEVTYLDNEKCNFTLSSAIVPNYPKAKMKCEWKPKNCNNIVEFVNESYVYAKVGDRDSVIAGKQCAHYEWEFEYNGSVTKTDLRNPRYTMPNEGGQLKVRLSAFLEDEKCNDVFDTTLTVDAIHSHDIKDAVEICWGDYVILGDQFIMESGVYVDTVPNIWGCDSIVTLDVTVREKIEDVVVYDTICSLDPYEIGDYKFDSTGVYEVPLKTALGCDSVVILHLEKMTPMAVALSGSDLWACADDSLLIVNFELMEGARSFAVDEAVCKIYSAQSTDTVVTKCKIGESYFGVELPTTLHPNVYKAMIAVEDTILACDDFVLEVDFDLYYSASMLVPKFDNMITVLDSENNGGYEFDEYKWYRDGELIEGEVNAFLYLGDVKFGGECYYLEVRRKDDGVVMRTCEICPTPATAVEEVLMDGLSIVPTIVNGGERIKCTMDNSQFIIHNLQLRMVDLCGREMAVEYEQEGDDVISVKAPMVAGIYLLQIGEWCEKIVVK